MTEPGLVVIGGGPGGLATVRAYRAAGGDLPITMLALEQHHPYRRPPLTKEYLRDELTRPELFMEEVGYYDDNDIVFVAGARADKLDIARRAVVTARHGVFRYEACVLATGSEPFRLPVPGGRDPNVYVMRTIEDSERLAAAASRGTSAVVVGSGFIGCEAAASLAARGVHVTLVSDEAVPQERRLGREAGVRLQAWLEQAGVDLRMGAGVERLETSGRVGKVWLESGRPILGDLVFFGTGVRPRIELAEGAGLELAKGAVATDASMRTSEESVWAVGDIACAMNAAAGRRLRVEHWGEALNHGAVAGRAIAGGTAVWDTAPGFWSTIGTETLKYVAWGDGHDEVRVDDDGDGDGGWTIWYGQGGAAVGVLTHNRDDDYERGRKLVESKGTLA